MIRSFGRRERALDINCSEILICGATANSLFAAPPIASVQNTFVDGPDVNETFVYIRKEDFLLILLSDWKKWLNLKQFRDCMVTMTLVS